MLYRALRDRIMNGMTPKVQNAADLATTHSRSFGGWFRWRLLRKSHVSHCFSLGFGYWELHRRRYPRRAYPRDSGLV
jgi:hypothetical protein